MKQVYFILLLCVFATGSAFCQKTAYIPLYLLDTTTVDGAQFTWSKTYEDSNFTIIWGDSCGLDPTTCADTTLRFNPISIADTMEMIYNYYKTMGFLNDSVGTNLHHYKIPIIMLNTFGPTGTTGYAYGGAADGIIGAFWAHPIAMQTGQVAAHELTHSLQAETIIDYRAAHGLGSVYDYAGIFWETHANFMRDHIYPQDVSAWGMDQHHVEAWGDWKNTYENYEILMAIEQADGIDVVNRLWRDALTTEYPLQAYKRLGGYTQGAFNDKMFLYARKMATFDFNYNGYGNIFRQYRNADLINDVLSVQSIYNILKLAPGSTNHYVIPIEQAPEETSYNVIPLYQNPDSCAVIIKFKGHTEVNAHAGWRYGFVTAHPDGTVSRYSPAYKANETELTFSLEGDETKMYLVVMGASADSITIDTANDTWHGYPKHFRYPYELTISGGVPEGFQSPDSFRAQLKIDGHLHPNGGGWVDNSASVAASVYVGPYAGVAGVSVITGNVRIDNTARVIDATVSGNVQVLDNAFVNTGTYYGNAVLSGNSYSYNCTDYGNAKVDRRANVANYFLAGDIEVGGDVVVYHDSGYCDNGVYYVLTNYYADNLLACDGRTAYYPTNVDVNNTYSAFTAAQMALNCNCGLLPGCLPLSAALNATVASTILAVPNPANQEMTFIVRSNTPTARMDVSLYNAIGSLVSQSTFYDKNEGSLNISSLPDGTYIARIKLNDHALVNTLKVMIVR